MELAELAPSRKADQEDLKSFLSGQVDSYRMPYARLEETVPRQCVFVGTTNEDAFLRDATGGRRFWPVTCGETIDADALAEDREQLFADAVAAFHDGEAWHLSPEMERLAAVEQEAAREEDPWEGPIREYLDGPTKDPFEPKARDSVMEGRAQASGRAKREADRGERETGRGHHADAGMALCEERRAAGMGFSQ